MFDSARSAVLTSLPDAPLTNFTCSPDPDNPGWLRWRLADETRYNEAVLGRQLVRAEGTDTCRLRMFPQHHHTNSAGNVHGAISLGLIDVSMFAALYVLRGVDAGRSVTVDVSTQFIGAGDPSRPLDAVVEVLRETRRLAFLRGLIMQDDGIVAAFSGTARKPSERK
ncbi:MAG: PaaI family thioesterase [Novosphingobium sp.]|nr:PaaI family thioesterase [Novosphingobium sp.]